MFRPTLPSLANADVIESSYQAWLADPNAVDSNGMTALHYAMRDGLKYLTGIAIVKGKKICGSGSGGRPSLNARLSALMPPPASQPPPPADFVPWDLPAPCASGPFR